MNKQSLKQKEANLKGEYRWIWRSLQTREGLTSRQAAIYGYTVNLPTRCSELEEKLGVTIDRKPIKLPSGKRCKLYSYRGKP